MHDRSSFWTGFAVGVLGVAGGIAGWRVFGRNSSLHVLRMEKSTQIGRPVHEVFAAWADFDRLQQLVPKIKEVHQYGSRSHWAVEVDGRRIEWDAELTQNIPNEALGWKSVRGPKHSGRISFSPLGSDTMVHVVMNYAPPLGRFSRMLSPLESELESQIEQALRDFKAALEGKGQEHLAATGTHGRASGSGRDNSMGLEPPEREAGVISYTTDKPGTVDFTRPPNAKY